MAAPRDDDRSLPTALHRLLEHYTPDGAGGRLLFALASGSATAVSLWLAILGTFVVSGFVWTIAGLVGWSAVFATAAATVAVCWPIYLSALGHVESAADYPKPGDGPSLAGREDAEIDDADDPFAICKRRYAAGEITEAEFERRVDRLLDVDARDGARSSRTDAGRRGVDDLERA